jgi:hypothetical protein
VLVAGLDAADPFPLLLRNPALLLAADPCDAHRAVFQIRLAALKCLGHREFGQLGRPDRWARLFPRIRWLVDDLAIRSWSGRVESLRASRPFTSGEFELMKVRATRIELVARPLDDLLAGLPSGFVDALIPGSACGSDPARLRAQMSRVVRTIPAAVRPLTGVGTMKKMSSVVPGRFMRAGHPVIGGA